MPLFDVHVIRGAVTDEERRLLIARLTDLAAEIWGDRVRPLTWVRILDVEPGSWGIGGTPFELPKHRRIPPRRDT